MSKPKPTTKSKVVWDDVPAIDTPKPVVADTPEEGVPFGSLSNIQQIIREYRKYFRTTPPEKNGQATAPNGTPYTYFMSGDVFDHADDFCASKGAMLDVRQYVENGMNIMSLTLEHLNSGEVRTVSANLGTPSSMSDFGSRITYAPKYLIAVMFGVSVQTDTDAFNNGVKKSFEVINNNPTQNERNTPNPSPDSSNIGSVVDSSNSCAIHSVASNQPVQHNEHTPSSGNNPNHTNLTSNPTPTQGQGLANSKSYEIARSFIEKSQTIGMLDEATVKINNSKNMTEAEKAELLGLIAQKRVTLG